MVGKKVSFRPWMPNETLPNQAFPKGLCAAPLHENRAKAEDDADFETLDDKNCFFDVDIKTENEKPAEPSKSGAASRREGGRTVISRKINIDNLDPEDRVIKDMKQQGCHDTKIAQQLVEQGLQRYHAKSISTRYQRIMDEEEKKLSVQLDEELTDWHEGDDEDLDTAKACFITRRDNEVAAAQEKFYNSVAQHLHALQKGKKEHCRFSKTACRSRDEAREAGTALLPLELDPDQDGRMLQRHLRAAEILRNKSDKQAYQFIEDNARRFDTGMKELKEGEAQRKRDREEEAKKRQQEKKLSLADQVKKLKAQINLWHAEALQKNGDLAVNEEEEEIFKQIEANQRARRRQVESRIKARNEEKENAEEALLVPDTNPVVERKPPRKLTDKEIVIRGMSRALGLLKTSDDEAAYADNEDSGPQKREGGSRYPLTDVIERQQYSWLVNGNPRGEMMIQALRRLARLRNVSATGEKPDLVYALAQNDHFTDVNELRRVLAARGVRHNGNKTKLMNRLALDDAGRLVNGSEFYENEVNPNRHKKRTFGSLSPASSDDEEPFRPSKRRRSNYLIMSEDSDDSYDNGFGKVRVKKEPKGSIIVIDDDSYDSGFGKARVKKEPKDSVIVISDDSYDSGCGKASAKKEPKDSAIVPEDDYIEDDYIEEDYAV